MKIGYKLCWAIVMLLTACQSSTEMRVECVLNDIEDDTLFVSYFPVSDLRQLQVKRDTLDLHTKKFVFEFPNSDEPVQVYFRKKSKEAGKELFPVAIDVIAFPGQTVRVTGTMDNYHVEGNDLHEEYEKIRLQCDPYREKMITFTKALLQMKSKGVSGIDSLRVESRIVYNKMRKLQENYIRQHLNEDVSVYLLSQLGRKKAAEIIPLLGDDAKNGAMEPVYRAMVNLLSERNVQNDTNDDFKEGVIVPDFTLKDIHGNEFTLSSLRGKYVILDFWGSWCEWCIKGIPDMKKLYEKYKDRLEIVGIDCKDSEEQWKEAVDKYELPWVHVRNVMEKDLVQQYKVSGFPTKMIVSPEGKLEKVFMGESSVFYNYVESLFK